jgi:hypothetical protein
MKKAAGGRLFSSRSSAEFYDLSKNVEALILRTNDSSKVVERRALFPDVVHGDPVLTEYLGCFFLVHI